MGSVTEQEHAPGAERGCDHRLNRPPRDLAYLHRQIPDAQRLAGIGFDLCVGLCAIDGVVQVDHPLL